MLDEDKQHLGKLIPQWVRPFASIIVCAISSIVMTGASVAIKKIDEYYSGGILLILMARFIVMLSMCSPFLCYNHFSKQQVIPTESRLILLLRCIFGTLGVYAYYFAFMTKMPLGDIAVIGSSATFFTCVYARIFLKEKLELGHFINIAFVVVGLMLIVQPSFIFGSDVNVYSENPRAIYAAIVLVVSSVFFEPNVAVLLRSLKGIPTFTIIASFSIVGFTCALIVKLVFHFTSFEIVTLNEIIPNSYIAWILLFAVGFLSFLGQIALTTACKIESAGLVSLVRKAFDIVISFMVQILVFANHPNAYGICGTLLISFVLLLSFIKKLLQEKLPEKHCLRSSKWRHILL